MRVDHHMILRCLWDNHYIVTQNWLEQRMDGQRIDVEIMVVDVDDGTVVDEMKGIDEMNGIGHCSEIMSLNSDKRMGSYKGIGRDGIVVNHQSLLHHRIVVELFLIVVVILLPLN